MKRRHFIATLQSILIALLLVNGIITLNAGRILDGAMLLGFSVGFAIGSGSLRRVVGDYFFKAKLFKLADLIYVRRDEE